MRDTQAVVQDPVALRAYSTQRSQPGVCLRPLALATWLLTLLRRHSALIRSLVIRDLKSRYLASVGGLAWSVLHPLLLLGVYAYVFSQLFHAEATHDAPFVIWLFCGLVPWLTCAELTQRGCMAVLEQTQLVTKTIFPSQLLPVILVVAVLVNHLLTLIVLALAVLVGTGRLQPTLVWLPVFMGGMALFALGVTWFTSALQVFVRDTVQVVAVLTNVWFFSTPVIYPESMLEGWAKPLLNLNPMLYVVRGYRTAFLGGPPPEVWEVAYVFGAGLLAVAIGGAFFRFVKGSFADVL